VRFPIQVLGFEDQNLSVEVEGVLSNPHLLVNGKHAEGDKGGPYLLRKTASKDGNAVSTDGKAEQSDEVPAEFRSLNWLDPLPRLVIGDHVVPYAPEIHWIWWVLAALPVPLILWFDRGIVPALWSGAVTLLNGRLLRTEVAFPLRIVFVAISTGLGILIPYLIFHYFTGNS
jgi:hypothetical protein